MAFAQRQQSRSAETTVPTMEQLREAHQLFVEKEHRSIFYDAALDLIELARAGKTRRCSENDGVAVLLLTWNQSFYGSRPSERSSLREDVRQILAKHEPTLGSLTNRDIRTLEERDALSVKQIFSTFDTVLWPVGAAKCLHIVAPRYFPLWDRAIARAYRCPLSKAGENADSYWRFMQIAQRHCQRMTLPDSTWNPLKVWDEFNYCKYTRGWLK
jgi:hypothetical protein